MKQLGGDGVPAGEPHADLSADAIPAPRELAPPVGAPRGFRFVGVSAGYAHTVLTGADGRAYAMGRGDNGQLALGHEEDLDRLHRTLPPGS